MPTPSDIECFRELALVAEENKNLVRELYEFLVKNRLRDVDLRSLKELQRHLAEVSSDFDF